MTRAGAGVALAAPLALVALAASAACSGSRVSSAKSLAPPSEVQPISTAPAAQRAADAARAPARSHQLAAITKRALGPFASRGEAGAIAFWVTAVQRGAGQELVVVPLADDGARLAEPHVVAKLPQEVASLVVRPASGAGGESLMALALAADGTARGAPVDLQRTNDHVAWLDLLPTARGAVCAWAEETPSGDANILTVALDADAKPRAMPVSVVRGVDRWQAIVTVDGFGLALVEPSAHDHAAAAGPAGKLSWQRLDAEGRPMGSAVPVGSSPTVGCSGGRISPVRTRR
jgi:hypothetical protein